MPILFKKRAGALNLQPYTSEASTILLGYISSLDCFAEVLKTAQADSGSQFMCSHLQVLGLPVALNLHTLPKEHRDRRGHAILPMGFLFGVFAFLLTNLFEHLSIPSSPSVSLL